MTLDFTTDHGKMALEQLENDIVIWFTTVTPQGTPQPNPVWFAWDEDSVITWVQPHSARIRNLASNPRVSLHFAGDPDAHHVTVLTGTAEIDEQIGSALNNTRYMEKYADRWQHIGMTPESAAEEYSVPIRIRLEKLRGF